MVDTPRQPMVWRPEFAVGVAVIDDQHRVLITMLGNAEESLTERSPIEDFGPVVQDLLNYAGYHFGTEETLMDVYGYGSARPSEEAGHRREHKVFAGKVATIKAALLAGQPISKAELLDFLTGWLSGHIMNTDKLFADHIREHLAHSPKEDR